MLGAVANASAARDERVIAAALYEALASSVPSGVLARRRAALERLPAAP